MSYQKMQYFTKHILAKPEKYCLKQKNKNGMMEGYTDNYIKITAPYEAVWENNIVEWKI